MIGSPIPILEAGNGSTLNLVLWRLAAIVENDGFHPAYIPVELA